MSELVFMTFKPGERSLDWEFTDPDTQWKYRANSRAELVKQIITYRSNNNLSPIESLDQVINDYLCRLPCNVGKCRPTVAVNRGFLAYFKGGILLLKSLMYDRFAPQSVAEERAKQCVECRFNVTPKKPWAMKQADRFAEKIVGSRKTSYHNKLGNCAVCTCPLRAKVFYDGEVSFSEEEESQMNSVGCWQLNLPREK